MEVQISEMSLAELRTLAKSRGIKSVSTLRKQELIDILGAGTESAKDNTDIAGKGETEREVELKKPAEQEEKDRKVTSEKVQEEKATSTQIRKNTRTEKDGETRSPLGQENGIKRATQNQSEESKKNTYWQLNGSQEADKKNNVQQDAEVLDSGETKEGILEVMPDGYGFIRCDNYLPGENDVYVSPAQIRRFSLKTGDIVAGNTRIKNQGEKFSALLYVKGVNGFHPAEAQKRKKFEDLTPVFPNERIHLETPGTNVSMRMVDLISPIGKGQRGMIVSQPKTGKTTLLKQIAKAITINHPSIHLIILLIDERPEEVTDIKESIEGKNVEVIYSTFDELPDNHKRVSEMVIERAKRLVEHKQDVVILLDSITRLARAYNLTVQASGRTLSGGLDPAALHMPKRFFGAARNMREGGSLTILATALVDTGSRMDDVVFEEFKGTGNMELVLDRNLSEKRIFPAIDLPKSSTRRDDLLLTQPEMEATYLMRKAFNSMKSDDAVERIIDMFIKTKTNAEFIEIVKKTKLTN
ncbi:transcription termination factor Rho [Anaerocolumna xylanovorans]|uniref:Transcription termination factor Rho n=1 Tax=Anaerocolumna xylanovorans DSM 12503 TaxID=1121345 RepID=A0A1M7YN97_9FIRM|nr:transcription termination factor Rho [Anaerocolumna xylanovorans]SHO54092.1 transcription termination factor Rho [Anaerocolumna xylanovorans DSM 12503]